MTGILDSCQQTLPNTDGNKHKTQQEVNRWEHCDQTDTALKTITVATKNQTQATATAAAAAGTTATTTAATTKQQEADR